MKRLLKRTFSTTLQLNVTSALRRDAMTGWPQRHVRSPLMRAVVNRMQEDERHRHDKHDDWYKVNSDLLPAEICDKFIQFHQDEETTKFLDTCYEKSDQLFTQLGHNIAKSVMSWFMSTTSINGFLRRGSMFVFSKAQLQDILSIDSSWTSGSLLDLGAGDGKVTRQMAGHFNQVFTTEVSSQMRKLLHAKNFSILGLDEWSDGSRQYDLISCLNLLDRCDQPMKILRHIKNSLTPDGRAVIAVVFPFSQYVEEGRSDHEPTEHLLVDGEEFEEQAASFISNVLDPAGFIVDNFSRLPYLCEGDLHNSFYVLDDAVFVVRTKPEL